jgi:formylglycine-generating enzyme required for sulfatase activity
LASWLRKQALLEKLPDRRVPQLRELKVEGAERKLFAGARVRRGLLGLRRPRPLPVRDLDVPATVRATIRQGGMFTPLYGARRTSPEYLLLIDRASAHDEQADAGLELYQRLHENGVFVAPYYFQDDARACRNALKDEAAVTLPQLAARYPEHRLLVFGDAAGFFDPYTGRPQRWLEQFASWEQRALLTPEARAQWGYRERELGRRKFRVLPADAAGLAALSEWFNYELTPRPAKQATQTAPFPPLIEERSYRWLERLEPLPEEIDELAAEVRAYLGPQSWDWLCACAAYPQITWELTLWHGYWLFGGDATWRAEWAERVLHLVRLPWFRHGVLPDWWRKRLLDAWEDKPNEAKTRRGIERLLWSAIEQPDQPVPLEYAEPQSLLARWQAWWQRQRLFWRLRAPKDSEELAEDPVRDYVFLRFLAGQRTQPLGVNVPEALRRLLFKDGQPVLGWQPVTLFVGAGLLSLSLWLFFMAQVRMDLPERPVLNAEPAPLTRPTVDPNAPLLPPATPVPAPSPSVTPSATLAVRDSKDGYVVELGANLTLELIGLPGGEFTMGSDKGEDDEKPPHQVRVTPFAMGKFEVTQAQWRAVMGSLPDVSFKGDDRPVETVSWNDAQAFCRKLSQLTGKQFRLPTEAEWEYAARAGTTTEYSFGDDDKLLDQYAWYRNNSGDQTHPVGQKRSNQFGLYDMHGNVWEWVQDVWHDNYQNAPKDGSAWLSGGDSSYRVLRGGSWFGYSDFCRSANRGNFSPGVRVSFYGFRVVASARN